MLNFFPSEVVSIMLMRNPQQPVCHQHEESVDHGEPLASSTSHEMLFGQLALIVLFSLAILLRTLA